MNKSDEFDVAGFRHSVENHWQHHGNCHHLLWSINERDDGVWQIEVAPVYQEVLGGEDDGKKVWTGFEFDLSGFLAVQEVFALGFGAVSYSVDFNDAPIIAVRGRYQGQPFVMKLHLEPIPDSEPVEIIDTIKNEVEQSRENDVDIDVYNLASLVYDELHKTCAPGQTICGLDNPWEARSEETQLAWEDAVRRALIRAAIIPGDPYPESIRIGRKRQFRKEKPKEGETS